MRISIDSNEVHVKSGTGKNGKPYEIPTQLAYLDLGKRYPSECKVRLADKGKPYEPGEYTIDLEKSCYVTQYGAVALSEELHLIELGKPAAVVTAAKA